MLDFSLGQIAAYVNAAEQREQLWTGNKAARQVFRAGPPSRKDIPMERSEHPCPDMGIDGVSFQLKVITTPGGPVMHMLRPDSPLRPHARRRTGGCIWARSISPRSCPGPSRPGNATAARPVLHRAPRPAETRAL